LFIIGNVSIDSRKSDEELKELHYKLEEAKQISEEKDRLLEEKV
jgi:hypothetical protein